MYANLILLYNNLKGSLDRKDKRSSWAASSITGGSITGDAFGEKIHDPGASGQFIGQPNTTSSMFDSFPPVTLTVSSFFKQVRPYTKDLVQLYNGVY